MSTCHHCDGQYDLLLVLKDRLVKKCRDCGAKWNEERTPEPRKSNYIRRDLPDAL